MATSLLHTPQRPSHFGRVQGRYSQNITSAALRQYHQTCRHGPNVQVTTIRVWSCGERWYCTAIRMWESHSAGRVDWLFCGSDEHLQ